MLYKQNIITLNQDLWKKSYEIIDGQTVLAILSNVYSKIQCNFNSDYDCDGIPNSQDNCPNDYNPNQRDTDKDGIGDVCSPDIDGDKVPNPKNIVDDNNRVNISALEGWTGQLDNCLFIANPDQKDTNHNGIGDSCEQNDTPLGLSIAIPKLEGIAPVQVPFEAIGEGLNQEIQRDFGDGQQSKGKTTTHTFLLPGTYRVQASTNIDNQIIKAQVIIIIGGQTQQQAALQTKTNSV